MSEYDMSGSAGIIEPEEETKKSGSILLGTAAGVVLTIVLELGVGLALDADTNLVHRYIAYLLGLLPIFVAAIMSRSILKMVFFGAPVIIISSFALPFFLPDVFTGLMTPFFTLLPIVDRMVHQLGNDIPSDQVAAFDAVKDYAIVIDFAVGFLVGMLAAIGLTGVVKLVTQKPGILTLITGLLSIIFFTIGVVFLPYFIVTTSGIAQFGLSLTAGGISLANGVEQSTSPNGSMSLADQYFAESQAWFHDAEQMVQGLEDLGLFSIIKKINPEYATIVDNGLILVNVAVDLAQALGPAVSGVGALSRGMQQSMDALNANESTSLSLSQTTDEQFNEGLDLIERGFANFSAASDKIKDALAGLNDLDQAALSQALKDQGVTGVDSQLDLITGGTNLLIPTLDVFTNNQSAGLIDDPDGDGPQRAPVIHLLQGAYAMSKVQTQIGESTSFQGTAPYFRSVIGNLTYLINSLDPSYNPAIDDLANADVKNADQIIQFRDSITGTIEFLRQAGNITIEIGRFGIVASPTLTSMNTTISFLTSSSDFTTIPASEYDNAINVFDGNQTIDQGIVTNATRMENRALIIRGLIDQMENDANEDKFGFLGEPANQFVTEFRAFNLTQNARNFKYIANGFSSLLKASKELTNVDYFITQIQGNSTIITQEIDNGISSPSTFNPANTTNSVNFVKGDVTSANSTLTTARYYLNASEGNFSMTVNMPQLNNTATSLGSIRIHMRNMQFGNETAGIDGINGIDDAMGLIEGYVANIQLLLDDGYQPADNTPILSNFTEIDTQLGELQNELDFIQSEFVYIQADLAGISIES